MQLSGEGPVDRLLAPPCSGTAACRWEGCGSRACGAKPARLPLRRLLGLPSPSRAVGLVVGGSMSRPRSLHSLGWLPLPGFAPPRETP